MNPLRYSLRIAAAAAILALATSTARAQIGTVPDSVDHYKTYKVVPMTFDLNIPVFLEDQFGPEEMIVKRLEQFANPVNKNNEGVYFPDLHYSWWRIEPTVPLPAYPTYDVIVGNQFGQGQRWKLGRPLWLLAPASKNDPTGGPIPRGDHYKCYEALDAPVLQKPVDLFDQFGQRPAHVDTARCLCNPVRKYHGGQYYPHRYPDTHLACYRIDPLAYDRFPMWRDQFYQGQLQILNDCWLCVPSSKQIVTSVKSSTWGRLKQLYQ